MPRVDAEHERTLLYPTADWTAGEAIHLLVEDVPLDSLMRTFDSLAVDYRPCVPYLARVVRLDRHGRRAAADDVDGDPGMTPVATG